MLSLVFSFGQRNWLTFDAGASAGVGGGGRRADARGPGQGLGKIREVIEGERRRKDGGGR